NVISDVGRKQAGVQTQRALRQAVGGVITEKQQRGFSVTRYGLKGFFRHKPVIIESGIPGARHFGRPAGARSAVYKKYISDERRTGRTKGPCPVDGKAVSGQTGQTMRRTTLLFAVILGLAGLTGFAKPALAAFNVCNKSNLPVRTAIGR